LKNLDLFRSGNECRVSEKYEGKGLIAGGGERGGGGGSVAGTRGHLLGAPIPILPTTTPTDQNFYIAYTLKYNAQ